MRVVIPSDKFLMNTFWNFPGVIVYHMIYLFQELFGSSNVSISGPALHLGRKLKKEFPALATIHKDYCVSFSEGQINDARQVMLSILTSTIKNYHLGQKAATAANYVEFVDFVKDEEGKVVGAKLHDKIKNKSFEVKAKVVVNCAGTFADELRQKNNPDAKKRTLSARGTHLVLEKGLLPNDQGILIPGSADGRLVFMLPYQGYTLVGTTDVADEASHIPVPSEDEVEFLKNEAKRVLGEDYDFEAGIKATWAGQRPLVLSGDEDSESGILSKLTSYFSSPEGEKSSAQLSRKHVIEDAGNGLVSLMGGKWTSYRAMGAHTVDEILKNYTFRDISHSDSQTRNYKLIGSYTKLELDGIMTLAAPQWKKKYEDQFLYLHDIPRDISSHLLEFYGTRALSVIESGVAEKKNKTWSNRIHPDLPFIEQEVNYAVDYEFAVKPNDIICRRLGLGVVDTKQAEELAASVVNLMAKRLKWGSSKRKQELAECIENLPTIK